MSQQTLRSYAMGLYTLQDEFQAVLKGVNTEGIGQVFAPKISMKDDGTLDLNFSIPMYIRNYLGEVEENPLWYDVVENKNLIVGLRKVKVVFGAEMELSDVLLSKEISRMHGYTTTENLLNLYGIKIVLYNTDAIEHGPETGELTGETERSEHSLKILNDVFEFLITQVEETHHEGILMCDVTASGLAFEELGKTGHKLSLNEETFMSDFKAYNDGVIAEVVPFNKLINCSISDDDLNGYTINTNSGISSIEFNLNSEYMMQKNKLYTFIFNCETDIASNDLSNKISINGREITIIKGLNIIENVYFNSNYIQKFSVNVSSLRNLTLSGFKLMLSDEVKATLNYWMDKVVEGTNWKYSINMDWSYQDGIEVRKDYLFLDIDERKEINADREKKGLRRIDEIYEDGFVSGWKQDGDDIIPASYVEAKIKERIIDCSESNRYNITQDIAEKFEVKCMYKYSYDEQLRIIDREIIFYNNLIKDNDPIDINFPYDAESITRTLDGNDVITKLYIEPITDDTNLLTGKISIADSPSNKSGEEYMLNFDYLLATNAITQEQFDEVYKYENAMHIFNKSLRNKSNKVALINERLAKRKGEMTVTQNSINAAAEQCAKIKKILSVLNLNGDNIEIKKDLIKISLLSEAEYSKVKLNKYASACEWQPFKLSANDNKVYYRYLRIAHPAVVNVVGENVEVVGLIDDGFNINLNNITQVDESKLEQTLVAINYKGNSENIYISYNYQPTTYYTKLLETYTQIEGAAQREFDIIEKEVNELEIQAQELNSDYYDELAKKNLRIAEFETMMGPAIREGSWSDENYRDYGENIIVNIKKNELPDYDYVTFDYYETPLDKDEETSYYEVGVEREKKYYPFIQINNEDFGKIAQNIDDLCIWQESGADFWERYDNLPDYDVTIYKLIYSQIDGEEKDENGEPIKIDEITKPPIKIEYNGVQYEIWSPTKQYEKGQIVFYFNNKKFYKSIKDSKGSIPLDYVQYFRINSGFFIKIYKINNEIKPVLMVSDTAVEYFNDSGATIVIGTVDINIDEETGDAIQKFNKIAYGILETPNDNFMVYPRFKITNMDINFNVNPYVYCTTEEEYTTESIRIAQNEMKIYKEFNTYLKYSNLNDSGEIEEDAYYVTLKPDAIFKRSNGKINDLSYILGFNLSSVATQIYLDARRVSYENAYPKVSYEVSVNAYNRELVGKLQQRLSQVCFINDAELKLRNVRGYISEIELDLDQPWEDTITVQNYKTKFEDLFSSIVASTESIRSNETTLNLASQYFLTNGEIEANILQKTFDNNEVVLNFGDGNITLSSEGLIINSANGKLKFANGGIYGINSNGESKLIMDAAGLSMESIKAGSLNLDKAIIYTDGKPNFQLNSNGLYAYRYNLGEVETNDYVVHNENGLFLTQDDIDKVEVSWDGLIIRNNSGNRVFYADDNGNLTLSGTIEANAGHIGNWLISNGALQNDAGTIGFDPYGERVFWTESANDYFYIDSNGVIHGTSGIFENSLISDDAVIHGTQFSDLVRWAVDNGYGKNSLSLAKIDGTVFMGDTLLTLRFYVSSPTINLELDKINLEVYNEQTDTWSVVEDEIYNLLSRNDYGFYFTVENTSLSFYGNPSRYRFSYHDVIRIENGNSENYTEEEMYYYTDEFILSSDNNFISVRLESKNGLIYRDKILTTLYARINDGGEEVAESEMNNYSFQWYETILVSNEFVKTKIEDATDYYLEVEHDPKDVKTITYSCVVNKS